MVGRDGRQSLRQQVVQRVSRFDLDDVTLLAQMFDVVDQQQLNAAVVAFGQSLEQSV